MLNPTTMKSIAQQLGVTVSTVSRALQDHPRIGLRTRERVHELAGQLGYVPNPTAINLKRKRTVNIGVVLPFLTEQFFSMAISGIEDAAISQGYSVLLMQSRNEYERERVALDTFVRHGVDGILVSMASETQNNDHFRRVNKLGVPVVFFDRVARDLPNSCVYADLTAVTAEAIAFLLARGLDRIALLNGPATLPATDERRTGYVAALTNANLPVHESYVKTLDLGKADTRRTMTELLDLPQPPQAVLAFHDYIALDAMQVCRERGLVINRDIFFVSYANLSFCTYLEQPPIASIEQFPYEMGQKATEFMIAAISNPDDTDRQIEVIRPALTIRPEWRV